MKAKNEELQIRGLCFWFTFRRSIQISAHTPNIQSSVWCVVFLSLCT